MAKPKYDGVVQAVRYDDEGQVLWVRAFLRRGPIWSDHIQLDRNDLIDKLNSGMKLMTGERLPYYGSTFKTSKPVKVVKVNSHEILIAGDVQGDTDCLKGVPLI
jgi:hypothetical protein